MNKYLPRGLKAPSFEKILQIFVERVVGPLKEAGQKGLTFSKLEEVPDSALDSLAWGLGVPLWRTHWERGKKIEVLQLSTELRRRAGSKWALEKGTSILGVDNIFTTVAWYEEGGEPFSFRLLYDNTAGPVSQETQNLVLEAVDALKSARD